MLSKLLANFRLLRWLPNHAIACLQVASHGLHASFCEQPHQHDGTAESTRTYTVQLPRDTADSWADCETFACQPSLPATESNQMQRSFENRGNERRGLELTNEELQALRDHLLSSKSAHTDLGLVTALLFCRAFRSCSWVMKPCTLWNGAEADIC